VVDASGRRGESKTIMKNNKTSSSLLLLLLLALTSNPAAAAAGDDPATPPPPGNFRLLNGVDMPLVGFGTAGLGERGESAPLYALMLGFRVRLLGREEGGREGGMGGGVERGLERKSGKRTLDKTGHAFTRRCSTSQNSFLLPPSPPPLHPSNST